MGLGLQGAYGVKAFTDTLEEIVAKRELARLQAEAVAKKDEQQKFANAATTEGLAIDRAKLNQPQGLDPLMEVGDVFDEEGNPSKQLVDRSGKTIRTLRQIPKDKPATTKKYQEVQYGVDVPGQKDPIPAVFDPEDGVYRDMTPERKAIQNATAHKPPFTGATIVMGQGPEGLGAFNKADNTFTPATNTATNKPVGRAMPAGLAEKLAEAESGIAIVAELQNLKQDGWLGPAQGRFTQAQMATPDSITRLFGAEPTSPQLAAFAARTARLKNAVIEAITGAAVGVQEAQRIMGEVPDFTDKPVQWQEKADLTARNLKYLHDVMMQRSGAPQNMRQPSQPPSATPTTKMPPVSDRVVGQTKWTFTSGPNSGKTGTWDGSAWVVK